MKFNKKSYLISLLLILVSTTTIVSCQKISANSLDTSNLETKVNQKIEEKKDSDKSKNIDNNLEKKFESLDISQFGFSLKENCLYLNDTILSARQIVNYTILKDSATFNLVDGTIFKINQEGNFSATFPIGIKVLTNYKLDKFETKYNNITITKNPIVNFSTFDNWYTIKYKNNLNIKFDSGKLDIYIDNISVNISYNQNITKYGDSIISNTNIESINIDNNLTNIIYQDQSNLFHSKEALTSFSTKDGIEFTTNKEQTTVKTYNKTYFLDGEFSSAEFNKNGNLTVTTEDELININKIDLLPVKIEEVRNGEDSIIEQKENIEENQSIEAENLKKEESTTSQSIAVNNEVEKNNLAPLSNNEWNNTKLEEDEKITRIGVLINPTLLLKPGELSSLGFRLDGLYEKKFSENIIMGIEMGLGADKFSNGFYKEAIFGITFSQEININKENNLSLYYSLGIGSLIPIKEDNESPFFRAKAELGLIYKLNSDFNLRFGGSYNYLVRHDYTAHSFALPIGLIYNLK